LSALGTKSWILRIGFLVCAIGLSILLRPFGSNLLSSVLSPVLLVLVCLIGEHTLLRMELPKLIAGTFGLLVGLCIGALLAGVFGPVLSSQPAFFLRLFLPFASGFIGLSVGLAKAESFYLPTSHSSLRSPPTPASQSVRYLDSSALIDGRIADLIDAGCFEGLFVIPQFVLNELQVVADTADPIRRIRGRRGLDVVARLQKSSEIRIDISPVDYTDVRQVDLKLVEAARERGAQLVTTDFNLSKLAQVQGIRVLNVNELATALRPVVLQGETLRVFIAKEGKEANQGVGYLEDGTMVVIDQARRQIGKMVDVIVTSVVQSAAGKMIFSRLDDGRSSSHALPARVPDTGGSQPK
jgi:uncharacterized protein YacL